MTDVVYAPADRLEVEVLVDGSGFLGSCGCGGRLPDGFWSANVMWSGTRGENRLDNVPAERVILIADAARPIAENAQMS